MGPGRWIMRSSARRGPCPASAGAGQVLCACRSAQGLTHLSERSGALVDTSVVCRSLFNAVRSISM
jgi:hypothetical protein